MNETTFSIVRQTAADIFGVPSINLTEQSSPEVVENWDSLQHLHFVMALESKFGISLSPEDMEQIRSLADAVRVVERRKP